MLERAGHENGHRRPMTADKILRGRTLTFHRAPQGPDDTGAYTYREDGALLLSGGLITAAGDYSDISAAHPDAATVDHRPHLILPGFIDTHLHFPQIQVLASWADQLLDWLNDYTFPAEAAFADPAHAATMASAFFDQLTAHGTTTAVAYCSSHKASADAFFAEAQRRHMRMIGGKVLMDRNAPEPVCDTPQTGYDDSKALIARWHGTGRLGYAITPRFAITSTPAQMETAQALAAEHPDCHIQTHLSENHDEIALTASLYPEALDYLGIYEGYGLLGPKTLLGHAIHLSDREVGVMAETGSKPVFCPTSNLFLGSGLYDLARMSARGIATGIATDIGGGTSFSMFSAIHEGHKILQLQRQRMTPLAAFDWITRGNAQVLGLADHIGTLDTGTEADLTVLNARATPAMALRMDNAQTLLEELFVLQIMGDDRAVAQTYVAGDAQK